MSEVLNGEVRVEPIRAGNSKIDKYNFGSLAIQLFNEGKKHEEIAKILSDHPDMMAAGDTISHQAVFNWLKKRREEQEESRKLAAVQYQLASMGADVGNLDTLADKLMKYITSGKVTVVQESNLFGDKVVERDLALQEISRIANDMAKLVATKAKILSDSAGGGDGAGVEINIGDVLKKARDRANEGTRAIDCTD